MINKKGEEENWKIERRKENIRKQGEAGKERLEGRGVRRQRIRESQGRRER